MNLGGKCYEHEVEQDLLIEPKEICDIERRRVCDSLYINLNKRLKKENLQLKEEILHLKNKLIMIRDSVYCNQISGEVRDEIIKVVEED